MTNPLLQSETATAAPAGRDHRASFVKLLHDQILKLNQAELDFGLYRILNRRRTEIHKYLNESLPAILQKATSGAVEKQSRALETAVRDLAEKLNNGAIGNGYEEGAFEDGELVMERVRGPNVAKYQEARQQLDHLHAQQTLSGSELDQLYLHLLTFFSRYYQGGDFLTVPRRGRARYLAPYSGEDTLFHWRSKGSHYVKTSTELRTYTYHPTAPAAGQPTTVRFELIEADTEQNNVKGDRRYFVPLPEQARREKDSFILPFSYRPLTEREKAKYIPKGKGRKAAEETDEGEETELSGNAQQRLLQDVLSSTSLDGVDVPELLKQANRYAKKNTSDYFVHPNLGPFLKGELDSYLLTEYLQPETLQTPEVMQDRFAKYRAMREAGGGLIDFLHQLEDFQAQLFEKRKFVLRADYLMPIRLVPEELWPALLGSAAQLDAWRDLFTLDLTGKAETEQMQALREHPTLVVDTQHHDEATKYKLLAAYENIESSLDGVLINSENYGALRTLEPVYKDRVNLIYIDPPYNTGGDGFLYKDEYSKHSTWLSMIEERVVMGRNLLSDDGAFFTSLDENESKNFGTAVINIFGEENYIDTLIWQKVYAPKNSAQYFSGDHEYVFVAAKDADIWRPNMVERKEDSEAKYRNLDNDPRGNWRPDNLLARNAYNAGEYEVISPTGKKYSNKPGTYWRVSKKKFDELDRDNRIWWGKTGGGMPALKRFRSDVKEGVTPQTLLTYSDVGHTQDAKREFLSIVPFVDGGDVFNTIKPKGLIQRVLALGVKKSKYTVFLDFFLGTGTSFDAFTTFKRRQNEDMRFVGVEMGEYFEKLTFQRSIRAMFAPDWKDGLPNPLPHFTSPLGDLPDWVARSPRLVQVVRLESFEDSLDALELPQERTEREKSLTNLFRDEYLVKYMLGDLTDGQAVTVATEQFKNPWTYHLRAGQTVDLPETFNLLLGLKVTQVRELHHAARRYLLVRGEQHPTGERVLVVWRDVTTDFDPEAEKTWLSAELGDLGWSWEEFQYIFVNSDSALPGAESLDAEFKRRMMVRDEVFRALSAGGMA